MRCCPVSLTWTQPNAAGGWPGGCMTCIPPRMRSDAQEREWLGPLRPDRLAEQLITGELTRRPELIAPLFTGLDEARAARALTVLARAALTQDRAVSLLRHCPGR